MNQTPKLVSFYYTDKLVVPKQQLYKKNINFNVFQNILIR